MSRRWLISGAGLLLVIAALFLAVACKTRDRQARNKRAEDSKELRVQAISYLYAEKFDEAEVAFKKAIQLDPDNVSNYVDLSWLYFNRNQLENAEQQIRTGLKVAPKNVDLMQLLAEANIQKGDTLAAAEALRQVLSQDHKNIPAYYTLSLLAAKRGDSATQKQYLLTLLDLSGSNIVVRLRLAELLARASKADSARFYLQSIRKIVPEFSPTVDTLYEKAVALLQAGRSSEALYYIERLDRLMGVSRSYAGSIAELALLRTPEVDLEFNDSRYSQTNDSHLLSLEDLKFTDATEDLGLSVPGIANATGSVLAVADDDGTATTYVYTSFSVPGGPSKHYLFKRYVGRFTEVSDDAGIDFSGEELAAAFADYDNDGYVDLFVSTTQGMVLYKNRGDGKFTRIKKDIGFSHLRDGHMILVADFDQDGDLDLYVACEAGNKFFRNNGDGTFTEQARAMNLASSEAKDMDFGDWDSDGDLDIALVTADGSVQLWNNNRHSSFSEMTDTLGIDSGYQGSALAFGDYNNDGMPDLFIAGTPQGPSLLLKNTGNHGYVVDRSAEIFSDALKDLTVSDATFVDFDNDGHADLVVAGEGADGSPGGFRLFHNDGGKGFSDVSYLLPKTVTQGEHMELADLNIDGDDDIFMSGRTGLYLVRNDGGSRNHYLQVRLKGLSYGNGKNNRLGIGAQVELKAGDLYQLKTVRRALTNFGVGARDSLDAVRIIWPNGFPQYVGDPSRRQKIMEQEELKGSCPFLFVWNGEKYVFLKDMMWRSALGMPLAIHGTDTTYAFSDPSKEYLLIPGKTLKPKNNTYSIKITEELWEAVYFDQANLIALDHPDSIDVFVDERFVAPPFPGKKLYDVAHKHYPVSATDDQGDDVLPQLKKYDFHYVSDFALGRYQGLTKMHDLILDLGDSAVADSVYLFLRGWIFPADASINMSMAQSDKYRQFPPAVQVMDKDGHWKTVIANMGFPMGKDKMVVVNLSGKFLTAHDRRIRIRTNMQIYWDEAFFSPSLSHAPVHMHDLPMVRANLSYRGYSATYRKGGPFGPHWFDYYRTTTGQKWRDLTGYYTRYGNVLPLLGAADDEYIIANSGDVITIDFDASRLPALPRGWTRDFLIYSEGWVKDGDLNTAYGQTVAPLPFHTMPCYPYKAGVHYPAGQHQQYLKQYNTRKVSTDRFKNAVKLMPKGG